MDGAKVTEFGKVFLAAGILSVFLWTYSDDMQQALNAFFLFVVLYYMGPTFAQSVTTQAKLGTVLQVLFAFAVVMFIGSGLFYYVTDLDYCEGWAKSEEYCSIQKIKDRYNDYEFEDY